MNSRSDASRKPVPGAAGYWDSLVKPALSRDAHRPLDRDGMRSAVHQLAAQGLQPRDIAQSLSITEAAVRQLLGEDRQS